MWVCTHVMICGRNPHTWDISEGHLRPSLAHKRSGSRSNTTDNRLSVWHEWSLRTECKTCRWDNTNGVRQPSLSSRSVWIPDTPRGTNGGKNRNRTTSQDHHQTTQKHSPFDGKSGISPCRRPRRGDEIQR